MTDEHMLEQPEAAEASPEAPSTETRSGKKTKADKKRAVAQAQPVEEAQASSRLQPEIGEASEPPVAAASTVRPAADSNGSAGVAQNYFDLGVKALLGGDYDAAENHYGQALILSRKIGDKAGQVATLEQLGHLCYLRGSATQAQEYYQQAGQLRAA